MVWPQVLTWWFDCEGKGTQNEKGAFFTLFFYLYTKQENLNDKLNLID